MKETPKVSVIIPCRNEEDYIGLVLEAISEQSFPISDIEVLIADGMSEDKTRDRISQFKLDNPQLKIIVLDNDVQAIPNALNLCLKNAHGEYIVRLDAHSIPNKKYVELSIRDLEEGKGANVGGVWDIQSRSDGWFSRGIAAAMKNPFGVGDAKYRYSDKAEEVETVPFGAFKRSLLDEIGYFDESLLANEDYEFNHRIRETGKKIWLNPEIKSKYYARPDLKAVWKQFWRYGYWKVKMLKRYPESIRLRQAIPPMFVFSLFTLFIGTFFLKPIGCFLLLEVVSYLLILMIAGIKSAILDKSVSHFISVPITIATMHISWGGAFLFSYFESLFTKKV